MKITGYAPSTIPGHERTPDIYFEGEMGGALWDLEHDTRRIHGTVSVIADGSVRWSTVSCSMTWSEREGCVLIGYESIRPPRVIRKTMSGRVKAFSLAGSVRGAGFWGCGRVRRTISVENL